MMRPCCLTVAGSDPCGGAGLQADIKTFEALGAHGAGVVSAVTAQNTSRVIKVLPVPEDMLRAQLDAVLSEMKAASAKTGMLPTAGIVRLTARALKSRRIPTVVDPVLASSSGAALQDGAASRAMVRYLFPMAALVTPNIPELSALTGGRVRSHGDALAAARRMLKMGARAVLVKGGHLDGSFATDRLLARGKPVRTFRKPRLRTGEVHGTGCVLSSAIAARLALGDCLEEATAFAERFMSRAMRHAPDLGGRQRMAFAHAELVSEAGRFALLRRLREAVGRLTRSGGDAFWRLIPEVGSNLAAALPCADSPEDVAAVEGRISACRRSLAGAYVPWFGVSDHMARFLLELREAGGSAGAVMNIRSSPGTLAACKRLGLRVMVIDRGGEPAARRRAEGTTLNWLARQAARGGKLPDVVADGGDWGKEPMLRVLGRTPEEVTERVLGIARRLSATR